MKKLTYAQVDKNFTENVEVTQASTLPDLMRALTVAIVDSINECIEESESNLMGKSIKFKDDYNFIESEVSKDQQGLVITDDGKNLIIHTSGVYIHGVTKESVYLIEDEVKNITGPIITKNEEI